MVDLIKKLFDPSLNLFRRTSNAHVYPSPMSNVSETNHLDLIEFAGKMLAKAIYEVRSRRTHLQCIWFFLPSLLLVRAPFRGGGENSEMLELLRFVFCSYTKKFGKTQFFHYWRITSFPSFGSATEVTTYSEFCPYLRCSLLQGIVLDVRLASFFLSQILGQTQSTFYSYLDDLPSLDEELYRSLMYVKRYDGDVADLCLTFSTTEECFGTVLTRDLIPGGRVINVTNYNKYVRCSLHPLHHSR